MVNYNGSNMLRYAVCKYCDPKLIKYKHMHYLKYVVKTNE